MESKIDPASFRNGGGGIQKLISVYKILRYGIRAGKGCVVKATSEFRLTDGAVLVLGNNVTIQDYAFFQLTKPHPKVIIGNDVVIGRGSMITAKGNITIGSYTRIGAFVQIMDHGHGFTKGDLIMNQKATFGDVYIGEDVWIGTGVKVLKGVKIGNGAVIGANAVVTKDIPSESVAVGVPARVIKWRGE